MTNDYSAGYLWCQSVEVVNNKYSLFTPYMSTRNMSAAKHCSYIWRVNYHFFMHTDPLTHEPTISELMLLRSPYGKELSIIKQIAADWLTIGHLIMTEATTKVISKTYHDSNDCCTEMMTRWLGGKGRQPVTWATLINVLKETKFSVLGHDLEIILLSPRKCMTCEKKIY